MANKALKEARKAYSKNKNTKYTWKDGKKTEKKKQKKKEKSVASSYGQVEKKTQTVGSQGKENRQNASVKKAASSVKKSVTPSRSGAVSPVSSHYGNVSNKSNDRTFTNKKWTVTDVANKVKETANVHSGANTKDDKKKPTTVSSHFGQIANKTQELGKKHSKKVGYDDSDVKNYIGKKGTAKSTEAGKAYNRAKTAQGQLEKEGEKKVTTTKNSALLYGIDAAIQKAGYMSKQPAAAAKFYDKEEKKAQKEGMSYGDKKEFIRKWVSDKSTKDVLNAIDEYKNQKIKDSSYTYTKAPTSTNEFLIRENASKYANNQTKTETNQPVYQTDKDGNIKYDKNGKPKVKKDKNGNVVYQKIDSNQGNNILDYYGGGFDENGRLKNQNASTKVGNQTAGWIHDAPVAAGVMQGLSYSDITRGLGNYSNAAAKDLQKTKESGAFNVGYMIGQGGQFLLGGTNKMTDALVKGIAKSGATRSALNVGLRKGAADIMFEAPINTLDAVKMATDTNGNFDKKAFFKYMALNTGLSGGMGGVIGGVGAKMTKSDVRKFAELSEKLNKNIELTPDELKQYDKIQKKLDSALQGNDRVKEDYINAEKADAVLSKSDKDEYMSLLGKKQTGKLTQQENVRLDSYNSVIKQNYDEAQSNYAKVLADASVGEKVNIKDVKDATEFFERSGDTVKSAEAESVLAKEEKTQVEAKFKEENDAPHGLPKSDEEILREMDEQEQRQFEKDVKKHEKEFAEYKRTHKDYEQFQKVDDLEAEREKIIDEIDGTNATPEQEARLDEIYEEIEAIKKEIGAKSDDDYYWKRYEALGKVRHDLLEKEGLFDKAYGRKQTPKGGKGFDPDAMVEERNRLQSENETVLEQIKQTDDADEIDKLIKQSDELETKIRKLGEEPNRLKPAEEKTPIAKESKETPKKTETQKLSENKYASDEVKTALKDIEDAGVYKEDAEKVAKKFNDLDGKIAGLQNRINNAKKKEYPTEAEKTAHIAELEDELRTLRNRQNNVAGEIEQMGKMKAVDNSKTAKEQIRELHGDRSVNKELKNADNLKNEDSWIKDKWNSVRRLWEDSLIDVENVAKKTGGELREQILTSANRVRNSMNVANNWITHTRKSFDNKVGGKALDDIFTKELIQNEAKYNDFQEYLIMKHVPARHEKGTDIYADISPELAEKRVKELEKEYGDIVEVDGKKMTEIEAWANDVYDYLKDLQQYRVDSGLLSKEAADQFAKDYPFYVPTNRVNDETVDFFTGGTSNGIRTAKGGESEVLDMYSQIYTATNKTIHAAEENQMLNLYFKAKGLTDAQIKDAELSDLEHAVIDAQVNKKTGAATVSFFVDGKPVKLPCSHQLALGLRELDGLEFERLMKAAKVATLYGKPFKALITDWNLVFGVRNGMRDLQQAVVNSKDTKYFGSSMGAAAHAIADNNSPYRKAYASMGGEQAQLVSYDAVAERMGLEKGRTDKIHEKVDEWVDASVNVKGKDVNTNPIHYIEGINGAIEMMPRMCEFIGTLRKNADAVLKKQGSSVKKLRKEIVAEVEALEKSGKVGASEVGTEVENRLAERILEIAGKDGLDSAMRNANDITLNFGRSGVLGKALNMGFVPYLNPSIQGLSKLARLFTEAGGEGGWKALASIGMKLGTFTIAPAVWNELALRNNEDFQNINTRDKDNNFFIALGDGKFLKIPKPRENAVLAEPVEYGLRYFLDKTEYDYFDMGKLKNGGSLWEKIPLTDEGKQSFRTALDNIGVINPATSNMFSPLWQTFHNKTWYGGSIESAYEVANKKSQDRYDTGTSGVAIWLGDTAGAKFLNLSPKKIDNIMDSYLGMIYDLGISQTTEEAKTRGNYVVRTMASQFIKDSVFSNKLSTKAWDKIDGMSEEKAQSYKSKYMYDTYKYDDAMDMITADKNMTVQEKMAAKRELQKQKNKINRAAIDGTDNESNPLGDIAKYLGAHKTLNNFLPKSGDDKYDTWTDYYKNYKKTKGFKGMDSKQKEKEAQKFLDVYTLGVKGQSKVGGDFHDSPSWGMTGVAAAQRYKQGKLSQKDATTIMQSCGVYESQTATYYKYADHGGNVSRYAVTQKNLNKANDLAEKLGVPTSGEGTIWKNKYSKEKGIKGGVYSMSLATGKADFKDRAYYIANSGDANMLIKMNAARGYSEKYGHTTKQLIKLGKKADKDDNTYLSNDEIESACNTIKKGKATNEEKAMAWVLLGGNPNKNPYGAIGDYSHDGDTGITMDEEEKSGGGRGRRRGRRGRRGRGGGGGSGKGTPPKTESGAIKGKVTDPFGTSNGSKGSNLNDAYRKRARKLREASRK